MERTANTNRAGACARLAAAACLAAALAVSGIAAAPAGAYAATKPATPAIAKVSPYTVHRLKVTVKPVSGASGYTVLYSPYKSFKSYKSVSSTKTDIQVKSLTAGKRYYVKVRAYKKSATGKITRGSWSKAKYATTYTHYITYNLNGGKWGSVSPRYGFYKSSATFSLKSPSRTGYSFAGWYTAKTFKSGTKATSIKKGTSRSKVLYAKWTPKTYTVAYNLAGGTAAGLKRSYRITDASFTLPTPVRAGYAFLGWYNASGTKVTKVAKGSAGNKSYTAKWEPLAYTISYDAAGGSMPGSYAESYRTGEAVALPVPTLAHSEFLGWFDASGAKVEQIAAGTHKDMALTARWTPSVYSIRYDMAGGQNDPSNPGSYTYGGAVALADPQPWGCHTFLGWRLDGEAVSAIPAGYEGDIVLTALWEEHHVPVWVEDVEAVEHAAYDETVRRSFYTCGKQDCPAGMFGQEVPRSHQIDYPCNLVSHTVWDTVLHHDAWTETADRSHCECSVCGEELSGHVHSLEFVENRERGEETVYGCHSGWWCVKCNCEVGEKHVLTEVPNTETGHTNSWREDILDAVTIDYGTMGLYRCSECGYTCWGDAR